MKFSCLYPFIPFFLSNSLNSLHFPEVILCIIKFCSAWCLLNPIISLSQSGHFALNCFFCFIFYLIKNGRKAIQNCLWLSVSYYHTLYTLNTISTLFTITTLFTVDTLYYLNVLNLLSKVLKYTHSFLQRLTCVRVAIGFGRLYACRWADIPVRDFPLSA